MLIWKRNRLTTRLERHVNNGRAFGYEYSLFGLEPVTKLSARKTHENVKLGSIKIGYSYNLCH